MDRLGAGRDGGTRGRIYHPAQAWRKSAARRCAFAPPTIGPKLVTVVRVDPPAGRSYAPPQVVVVRRWVGARRRAREEDDGGDRGRVRLPGAGPGPRRGIRRGLRRRLPDAAAAAPRGAGDRRPRQRAPARGHARQRSLRGRGGGPGPGRAGRSTRAGPLDATAPCAAGPAARRGWSRRDDVRGRAVSNTRSVAGGSPMGRGSRRGRSRRCPIGRSRAGRVARPDGRAIVERGSLTHWHRCGDRERDGAGRGRDGARRG